MALQTAGGAGTTIAKSATTGNIYTVPEGKTFKGVFWSSGSVGPGGINGTTFYWPYFSNYFAHTPIEISLNGGDVVNASNSGHTMVLGVEY